MPQCTIWNGRRSPTITPNRVWVEIKEEVLDFLESFRQYEGDEIGGVLTGSEIISGGYRIGKASDSCIATKSRYYCERDANLANQYIQEDYKVSEGTRYYIGEWHTHPEAYPHPSPVDISSMAKIYASAQRSVSVLFMIIVGTTGNYVGMYDGNEMKKIEYRVV